MKKFLILSFFIFLPFQVFAFFDTQNSEFRPYIENMISEKLISWYSDGKFRPSNPVSFFEALKISINTNSWQQYIPEDQTETDFYKQIYENKFFQNEKIFKNNEKISRDFAIYLILKNLGINLENTKIENNFTDVNPNSLFSNYINFAKNNWIINGYSNGNFWPNNPVTRWEFTKMAWTTIREKRDQILENFAKISNNQINNNQKNTITATVVSVSDGDTITIKDSSGNTNKIRILWLDTPESFDTRFGYIECYGKEASDFLKKYLPVGTTVQVIYYGNDKYSRDLAEVFVNNESIATTMIKNGYGWVYRWGIEPSNYSQLLELENSLRNSNIGLWASNTCNWERKKAENLMQPVTNTIIHNKNTNTSSNNTWNPDPFQKEFYNPNCHIKWNINSKWERIYHLPSWKFYDKTEPEVCFNSEQEAISAGFRASKQ